MCTYVCVPNYSMSVLDLLMIFCWHSWIIFLFFPLSLSFSPSLSYFFLSTSVCLYHIALLSLSTAISLLFTDAISLFDYQTLYELPVIHFEWLYKADLIKRSRIKNSVVPSSLLINLFFYLTYTSSAIFQLDGNIFRVVWLMLLLNNSWQTT